MCYKFLFEKKKRTNFNPKSIITHPSTEYHKQIIWHFSSSVVTSKFHCPYLFILSFFYYNHKSRIWEWSRDKHMLFYLPSKTAIINRCDFLFYYFFPSISLISSISEGNQSLLPQRHEKNGEKNKCEFCLY